MTDRRPETTKGENVIGLGWCEAEDLNRMLRPKHDHAFCRIELMLDDFIVDLARNDLAIPPDQ